MRHSQIEEVSHCFFRYHFGVIDKFFLHLFELQRFYLAVPTEGVVAQQALGITDTERHTGELGGLGFTEVAHIVQIRIDVEGTTGQVEVLLDAQSSTGTEHLLFTVHVRIRIRIVTLGDVTVVLGWHQVQRQTWQSVGLVGTVLPITGQIHVLVTEGRQGAVVCQFDGALQVQFDRLLGLEG